MNTSPHRIALHPWPKLSVTIEPDYEGSPVLTWSIAPAVRSAALNTLQNVVLGSAVGSVDTVEEAVDESTARQRCTQAAQSWLRKHGIEPMTVLWHGELL